MPNWSSKPSFVVPYGAGHQAGVVDEEVEAVVLGEEPVGEGANAVERGEIELSHVQLDGMVDCGADALGGRFAAVEVAHRHDDLSTVVGEGAGRLLPEPGRSAGDHRKPAREVDAGQYVVGGGGEPERGHRASLA